MAGTGSIVRTIFNASSAWEPCTRYTATYRGSTLERRYEPATDCSFGVIGRDEIDIPIIVTRVGNAGATKKIVITGFHNE